MYCFLLSFRLFSKNLKIKIYKKNYIAVVLYGCETWSLTLREKRRLRVFKNGILRRIYNNFDLSKFVLNCRVARKKNASLVEQDFLF
jgi:hypothetical protein